jgi:glycine/sarcosine N-methyltransferase
MACSSTVIVHVLPRTRQRPSGSSAAGARLVFLNDPGGQLMSDLYLDLASDYEWLFSDDVTGPSPVLGATSPGSRDLLEAAVATLAPGAQVLDCACGTGADAAALMQRGFDVTATDGSSSMVARARERLATCGTAASVLQSSWEQLPGKLTHRFDLAICLGNSMVHAGTMSRVAGALRAIRDVLKPGGMVVVDSRNWELMYESRPRVVPARRVIERRGTRCASFYIWTIPESFDRPCQAEIVFLFQNEADELSHRRYELTFQPFRHMDLRQAVASAGFRITGDSFQPTGTFYAIAAMAAP